MKKMPNLKNLDGSCVISLSIHIHTHFWLELAFSSFLIKNNEYMICCSLYFIQLKKDKQCIMIKVNKYCKYTAKSLQSFHFCQTERKKVQHYNLYNLNIAEIIWSFCWILTGNTLDNSCFFSTTLLVSKMFC